MIKKEKLRGHNRMEKIREQREVDAKQI